MTEIDRVPLADAQASSGLGRTLFYRRLGQAGITPLRVGGRSFLTGDHLQALTRLAQWIDQGGDPEQWPEKAVDAASPAGGALAPSSAPQQLVLVQSDADAEPDAQAPQELVLAELDLLERLLPFLEKAAASGWLLPTSTIELLVGARPRGRSIERYGFTFRAAGAHGRETAWAISRAGQD